MSKTKTSLLLIVAPCFMINSISQGQIWKRFPSERKLVKDPVTRIMLTF